MTRPATGLIAICSGGVEIRTLFASRILFPFLVPRAATKSPIATSEKVMFFVVFMMFAKEVSLGLTVTCFISPSFERSCMVSSAMSVSVPV